LYRTTGIATPTKREIDPVEPALRLLDANLSVKPTRTGNVIELSFTHPDPEIAAEVLKQLEEGFLERRRGLYLNQESEFVSREAASLQAQLETADAELASFKAGRGIGDYQVRRQILLHTQAGLEDQLRSAAAEIAQDQARLAQLNDQALHLPPEIMQYRDADVDQRLTPLRVSIETARAQLQRLRASYVDESAVVAIARRQLLGLESELARGRGDDSAGAFRMGQNPVLLAVEQDRAKVGVDLQAARAGEAAVRELLTAVTKQLTLIDDSELRLTQLERTRSVLDENYRAAVKIRDERLVSESVQADRRPSVRVLQPPVVPVTAQGIRRLILEAGFMLGLIGAGAVGLVSHFLRRVYLIPEAMELDIGLPVLMSMPDMPRLGQNVLVIRPR
jgi:uncharacterized protein involved in exopolysaccharide biosynthesis